MAGVWVALEDMDDDNGPLVYYPGSHKLPELSMADIGAAATKADYDRYEAHVADLIEREGLEPHHATISKGQGLIWAANLLHGGSPQNDRSRTRHSQVTHFFFEGCKYYTPMLSDDHDVHWRDPVWIR
jgi:ectoine hydroxylase-related dioxygenase (phytanoyl-CoA dioxygenase family)